ncbi:dockerin type I domain-containing protein [Echinimonas agarilytica]|uniref:Probable pectate lyase C n=1 Tax=Echinimonas agarilytica TaxID=1215918 RepID=A0AA41W873_9GAMM|nr:dockerin type I domain-containing protein [Echinimonas agarilytica]MCM2680297.1 hypothetical protein [Echinimonas agarilytica]
MHITAIHSLSKLALAVSLCAAGLAAPVQADSLAGAYQESIIDQDKEYFVNLVNDASPTVITAIPGETWTEQTARVQAAIDAASQEVNGGVVQLVGAQFRLGHIELKDNVRVEVDPNATIDMMEKVLFDMGRGASNFYYPERQQNIEVTSMVQGEKFTINVNKTVKKRNAIPFRVGYVYNYALSHFHVDDYYTIFPSVFIVADSDNRKEEGNLTYDRTSFKGAIVNASSDQVHTGYALVQPFSGKRIYMKDLDAEGGLTIRLEPGSGKSNDWLNRAGQQVGTIEEIRLINIHNSDGMAALFLKSHQKIISQVHATNITATDSAFAVMSNSSDSKVFQRGRFEDIKIDGVIRLDQTYDETRADIGPSSQYYVVDSHLEQLQALAAADHEAGNRNNTNPIYSDLPLSPTEDRARRETKPMAPVLMASSDRAENAGSRFLGRWQYDISQADIQASQYLPLEHENLVLYRQDARLLNGRPATDWAEEKAWDMDGDGVRNRFEDDFDGDEVLNEHDAFPYDKNETMDSDDDGYGDNSDAFPFDPSEWADHDGDLDGNNIDDDDDNDNVDDTTDVFPFNTAESVDTDDDSIGNNTDTDDDHDGIDDALDHLPLDARVGILGDLDGDKDVDSMDIRAFSHALRGHTELHPVYDLNGDQRIDRRDVRELTKLCTRNRCGVK